MTATLQLMFAVWFTAICAIGCFGFLGWLMWNIFWDWYDGFMQTKKRRINRASDTRASRDAFRDVRGVHR